MLITYIKYISLLVFSGLILTFYLATTQVRSADQSIKTINVLKAGRRPSAFSLLKDVILPLFPVLNKVEPLTGNKKLNSL